MLILTACGGSGGADTSSPVGGTLAYVTRGTESSKTGFLQEEALSLASPLSLLGRQASLSYLARSSDSTATNYAVVEVPFEVHEAVASRAMHHALLTSG
jgi:hypothetical protein